MVGREFDGDSNCDEGGAGDGHSYGDIDRDGISMVMGHAVGLEMVMVTVLCLFLFTETIVKLFNTFPQSVSLPRIKFMKKAIA